MRNLRIWPIFGLALLIAAGGCIFSPKDDPPDDNPPPAKTYRQPTHPDSVALNYEDIYADMEIDAYRDALDPDFLFIPVSGGENYNFDSEIATTRKIFQSEQGTDNQGNPVPPITSITFDLRSVAPWQEIPPDDTNFGGANGQRRNFQLEATFERRAPATTFIVTGSIWFYVKAVQANGRTEYRVLGIIDNTSG